MAQVLDYLADDASTQTIVVYMESISDARRFMSSHVLLQIPNP